MRLDPDKLGWGLDVGMTPEPPDEAGVVEVLLGTPTEQAGPLRAALARRIADGDVWAWCRLRVTCYLPGADWLQGEAVLAPSSWPDESAFLTSSAYQELRTQAQADLERRLDVIWALAAYSQPLPDDPESAPPSVLTRAAVGMAVRFKAGGEPAGEDVSQNDQGVVRAVLFDGAACEVEWSSGDRTVEFAGELTEIPSQ